MSARSDRAVLAPLLAVIDRANAEDPNLIDGRPRALLQGERATFWLDRLRPDAPDALVLATRAHHVARWSIARTSYPEGRAGYLRWRRDLKDVHANVLGALLAEHEVDKAAIGEAQTLVAKRGDLHTPDAQSFEDVVCLVFLETQYEALIDRLDDEKMVAVLRKTLPKMSPAAIALAGSAELHPRGRDLLARAAAGDGQ